MDNAPPSPAPLVNSFNKTMSFLAVAFGLFLVGVDSRLSNSAWAAWAWT